MSVDASFDAQLNVNVPRFGFDRSFGLAIARADSIQWVDPVLGLRLRHQFTPRQSIFIRGDIGGFGLGGSSHGRRSACTHTLGRSSVARLPSCSAFGRWG